MFQDINKNVEGFNYEKVSIQKQNDSMNSDGCCQTVCPNVCEAPRERVCHRYFNYEVPHIIPCNTRIINHHVYRHTYIPQYTCCEENECSNVFDSCPNNFF